MRRQDLSGVIDVHEIMDRLERAGNTQDYYILNHSTPKEIDELQQRLTATVELWLTDVVRLSFS